MSSRRTPCCRPAAGSSTRYAARDVKIRVPRDRDGDFQLQVLPRCRSYDERITGDIAALYLTDVSTRTLSLPSRRLIGRSLSPAGTSSSTTELKQAVEKWRMRDLSREKIKYLFIDGVNFRIGIAGSIELVPALVAIGAREDGTKLVLSLQGGDKESSGAWREFFKDLKRFSGREALKEIMDLVKEISDLTTEK